MSQDLIINDPKKPTEPRRSGEVSLTLFGWMVWLFLCRPLFILCLWALGLEFFYKHMIALKGFGSLLLFFSHYTFIIVFIFIFLRGWNVYNRVRFRGKDKRNTTKTTFFSEAERFFELPEDSIHEFQNSSEVRVDFKADSVLQFTLEDQPKAKPFLGSLRTYFARQ